MSRPRLIPDLFMQAVALTKTNMNNLSPDPREVGSLIRDLEQLHDLDLIERSELLTARTHLQFGRVESAAFKVCDLLSRRMLRDGGAPSA
jgi:hypothetical protein